MLFILFLRHTFLRMIIPSWLCSLVVMSNMAPPSPGTMVYSTSAFFPMSKSWALILPTADPRAEDSGTLRWKKPVNKQTSDWTQSHLYHHLTLDGNTKLFTSPVLYVVSCLPEGILSTHRLAADMLSVWSQPCGYRHDIIQFWRVWTSRVLNSL